MAWRGEAQGLGRLLAQAFAQRAAPATLEDLRKNLGADRVEAVDLNGAVVDGTKPSGAKGDL